MQSSLATYFLLSSNEAIKIHLLKVAAVMQMNNIVTLINFISDTKLTVKIICNMIAIIIYLIKYLVHVLLPFIAHTFYLLKHVVFFGRFLLDLLQYSIASPLASRSCAKKKRRSMYL